MTSSVDSHVVPPFYACYLLRSYATSSSARTYIGSTPDPARRKKQHNGLLTQGAHKTKRGRPWETQMLVYGFPSKIAALQFEWAWQKPHMSRHLRTHPPTRQDREINNSASQQQQHIALPLFTDTPLNQIAIGEDGSKPLACSSVQTSLMVARALLRSEPFAGWGLRIIFFEEYLWAAWNRLHEANEKISMDPDFTKVGLFLDLQQTRLRRILPPLTVSPNPICDFAGVDGEKKNMLTFTEEERKNAKLDPPKPGSKGKGKTPSEGRPAGIWPERLPVTLNVRNMGGGWPLLENAPFPASSMVERGKKKAQEESTSKTSSDLFTAESAKNLNRFHLDDEDVSLAAFKRFLFILDAKSLSIENVLPIDEDESGRAAATGSKCAEGQCSICKEKIKLRDHTSYSVCPSPFEELMPKPLPKKKSSANRSLSQFGFGNVERQTTITSSQKGEQYMHCQSIFHIHCLADCFLEQSNQKGRFLLPTHGYCPVCYQKGKPKQLGAHNANTWNEIIRCVFRRKDAIAKEVKSIELAKMKAAKVAIQQAKKVRKKAVGTTTTTSTKTNNKKKTTKSQTQEQNIRQGDSDGLDDDEDEDDEEKDLNVESTLRRDILLPKSITTSNEKGQNDNTSLLSKITALGNQEKAKSKNSNLSLPTASGKRSIPTNWTPEMTRTAPSDRTIGTIVSGVNTALPPNKKCIDENDDSLLDTDTDEELLSKPIGKSNMRKKQLATAVLSLRSNQQEVIDLT